MCLCVRDTFLGIFHNGGSRASPAYTPKRVKINAIRTLKLTNYSLTQDKLAFSNKDEVWFVMEMKNIIKNQERVIEEMILEQLYPKKEKRRSKRLDRNELALIKLFL